MTPALSLPTENVSALIPHRGPMQLLDAVLSCDQAGLVARARLRPGHSFCGAQGVPACIGLEYLGQAAAAFFSALALQSAANSQSNANPSIPSSPSSPSSPSPTPGMLIASRSFSCSQGFFPVPADLLIEIAPASAISGSTISGSAIAGSAIAGSTIAGSTIAGSAIAGSGLAHRGLVKFSGTISVLAAGTLDALDTHPRNLAPAFAQGDLSVYLPPA